MPFQIDQFSQRSCGNTYSLENFQTKENSQLYIRQHVAIDCIVIITLLIFDPDFKQAMLKICFDHCINLFLPDNSKCLI